MRKIRKNVLVMNVLHHRAFDAGLFTFDVDHRVRTSPSFDPGHPFLRESLIERQSKQIELPHNVRIGDKYLEKRNSDLGWL